MKGWVWLRARGFATRVLRAKLEECLAAGTLQHTFCAQPNGLSGAGGGGRAWGCAAVWRYRLRLLFCPFVGGGGAWGRLSRVLKEFQGDSPGFSATAKSRTCRERDPGFVKREFHQARGLSIQ